MTETSERGERADQHPFVRRPHRTILSLSLPILLSLVAEPLTGLVDTAFVARLGSAPLAALGISATLLSGVFWVFNFLGIGTQTEVARALGARDRLRAGRISALALVLALALGTALCALAWPFAEVASRAMEARGEVLEDATHYLRIRLLGGPAVLATLACFGALRGLQDMRTPLFVALVANALNIALDALLIFGAGPIPALGISGAALASTLSLWVGAALAIAALRARLPLPAQLDLRAAGRLLVVGRDLVLRSGTLLLFLALSTRSANLLGGDAGAAHQAIRQVWMFSAFLLDAYASTAQSLVGYFLAASRIGLARSVAAKSCGWGLGTGALLCGAMLAGGGGIEALLVPPSAQHFFPVAWSIAALSQPLNGLSFVTDGILWGAGDYRYLRNAMFAATALGTALLVWLEASGQVSLPAVWAALALWIAMRAALGAARVWPGIGRSPLRVAA